MGLEDSCQVQAYGQTAQMMSYLIIVGFAIVAIAIMVSLPLLANHLLSNQCSFTTNKVVSSILLSASSCHNHYSHN
jgi:succinate dehydrogenase hydrophobic anchor subunit